MKRVAAIFISVLISVSFSTVLYAAPEPVKEQENKSVTPEPEKAVAAVQKEVPASVAATAKEAEKPGTVFRLKTEMAVNGKDPRIRHIVYNPDAVVRIDAYPGIATHIVFAKGEQVVDHGTGFTKAWELVPNGQSGSGNYYLKPKAAAGDTNLFISTNKRDYSFDLILHKDWRNKLTDNLPVVRNMTYRVVFSYPQDEAARLKKLAEEKNMKSKLSSEPKPRNWNYTMHVNNKSEEISPKMAYDDGRFTYLRFPNNREIPTIYQVAEDESESIVNHHVIDDMVVMQRVGRQFILRLGSMTVGLFNESYDPEGLAPQHGMTVDGLQRVIKGGE